MRTFSPIYYETPGGAPGGAPPPATPPTTPQPPASGQGQGQGQTWDATAYRQQYFPNVPDEVWQAHMHEPMQRINQHVTGLEQTYAPLKGYTPQTVQGLARMAQGFSSNPIGTWIEIAELMQQQMDPKTGRPVLDPDIDLEHLAALASGQDPEQSAAPQGLPAENGDLPPAIAQHIQSLEQQVRSLMERLDNTDQTTRQRTEDAALNKQLSNMKRQLKAAGFPDETLTDQFLLGTFVAHRGNVNAAVETATGLRTNLMKGVVPDPERVKQQKELDMPEGVPSARARKPAASGRRGMFRDVTATAEQALARMEQQ